MKKIFLTCTVPWCLLFQKASIFMRITFFIFPIEILKKLTSMQKAIVFWINSRPSSHPIRCRLPIWVSRPRLFNCRKSTPSITFSRLPADNSNVSVAVRKLLKVVQILFLRASEKLIFNDKNEKMGVRKYFLSQITVDETVHRKLRDRRSRSVQRYEKFREISSCSVKLSWN